MLINEAIFICTIEFWKGSNLDMLRDTYKKTDLQGNYIDFLKMKLRFWLVVFF